jgi:hypothetical protein
VEVGIFAAFGNRWGVDGESLYVIGRAGAGAIFGDGTGEVNFFRNSWLEARWGIGFFLGIGFSSCQD